MNRRSSITLGLLLTALLTREGAAQWNVARYEAEPNRVYSTFALDPALITSLGYARVASLWGHDFQLSAEAGVVTAELDTDDFRARLGVHTSLARWRFLHVTGSATFVTRGTDNAIYRGFNFGADVTGGVGVYRPLWFASAEFGKDKAIITHVTHSDWYRDHFYADARDGWYLDAGGTYHYGVKAGFTLGQAEVVGRFGQLRTEKFNDMTPPLYASLGVGFAF